MKSTLIVVAAAAILSIGLRASPPSNTRVDARAFVTQHFVHGIPYGEAHDLGPAALDTLAELLRDESHKAHWSTIATTIGFIGAPRSHALLHEFVWGRFEGEVDLTTFQALIAAQGILGHVAANDDAELLYELIDGVDPSHWDGLPWTFERYDGPLLSLLWSKLTINALSYSGAPAATQTLLELQARPHEPRQLSNITEGITRIREIAAVGLDAYERARDEQRRVR